MYFKCGILKLWEQEHVEKFLCDFCITIPNKSNIPDSQEQVVQVNANLSNVENTTGIGIKIVSSISLSNDVQAAPTPTTTHRLNKERFLVPKISSPLIQTNMVPQVSHVNLVAKEKGGHILRIKSSDKQNPVPILQDKTANNSNFRNATQMEQSTKLQSLIRILNRNIDAPQSQNTRVLEQPLMNFTYPGLIKSFAEKSVVQSRSVFLPPTVVHIPLPKNSKSVDEVARLAHYRKIIAGLYDVPGTYTCYKERNVPNILDARFSEPADSSVTGHIFVPSYFDKKPVRTYQERPMTRVTGRSFKGNMSLSGIRIDSVHQVNGKVHICTMGEAVINKESETLFEDHPLSYLNPSQVVSRLSVEHNYSFGETPAPVDHECSNRNELATDMEDLNRAIQLVIAEQRRKNRMKNRIQSYTEEIETLKRRAVKLLDICHQMKNEAHEIDPDFRRPKKKVATDRTNPPSPSKDLGISSFTNNLSITID